MKFTETKIKGVYCIEPELIRDERGYFTRTFCQKELESHGIEFNIAQTNLTLTLKKGTIRGMHFQSEPKAEAKIVQCLKGSIYDVAIDLRKNSPTYSQWVTEELTGDNKKMLYIPKGCAHGLQTLTDDCEVSYLMSEFYSPEHSKGVSWNDPFFNIQWPVKNPSLSEKDKNWSFIKTSGKKSF
ncbi:MAG: dTDP-4-dehydrorhamnose 3,5-epimerase [Candidatus Gracilibacteria bacterium]